MGEEFQTRTGTHIEPGGRPVPAPGSTVSVEEEELLDVLALCVVSTVEVLAPTELELDVVWVLWVAVL